MFVFAPIYKTRYSQRLRYINVIVCKLLYVEPIISQPTKRQVIDRSNLLRLTMKL